MRWTGALNGLRMFEVFLEIAKVPDPPGFLPLGAIVEKQLFVGFQITQGNDFQNNASRIVERKELFKG